MVSHPLFKKRTIVTALGKKMIGDGADLEDIYVRQETYPALC